MIELFVTFFEHLSTVGISATVIGGLVAVFLPCNFPMLIGYVALLIGDEDSMSVPRVLKKTLQFFLGFALTYVVFGSVAGFFGQFSQTTLLFNEFRPILVLLGGLFFIVIGLVLLRTIPLPSKLRGLHAIPLPKSLSTSSWFGSALAGVIFAAGWSPCIGPVLGGILVLAASSGSVLSGAFLLFLFAFSMMLPLAVVAVLYSQAAQRLKRVEAFLPAMRIIGGVLFLILGILFVFGRLSVFTLW